MWQLGWCVLSTNIVPPVLTIQSLSHLSALHLFLLISLSLNYSQPSCTGFDIPKSILSRMKWRHTYLKGHYLTRAVYSSCIHYWIQRKSFVLEDAKPTPWSHIHKGTQSSLMASIVSPNSLSTQNMPFSTCRAYSSFFISFSLLPYCWYEESCPFHHAPVHKISKEYG